ncbi:uncharacterized protein LOC115882603 [Sitophilus oryzae]|uniref:Glycosyltransferase family 92 protein n=1 Tax=Sitophilus oryzae TaxID=7048 RepID=A0A6J2Y021_SITOR|nr:uncharacterized protein LOC115882603 [Sitophilus oryzae]
MILKPYWTLFFVLTIFIFVYYNVFMVLDVSNRDATSSSGLSVTNIVAYSLKKRVELDSEEYFCDKIEKSVDESDGYSGKSWRRIRDSEVYVYSVNMDRRLEPYIYLRIIAMIKGSWNGTIYCQFLSTHGHIKVIKSTVTPIWFTEWDKEDKNVYYNPTFISCRVPHIFSSENAPKIFLSTKPCEISSQAFHVYLTNDTEIRNFTVCVKPMNFQADISNYLVQWIEMNKLLGAEYFHIFLGNINENTRKILKWYKSTSPNMFKLENFELIDSFQYLPTDLIRKTWQRRRYEIISYNECFYKNLNSKYIIPLDIDEIILPKTADTWRNLVHNLHNYASLSIRNVYFFTEDTYTSNKSVFFNYIYRTGKMNQIGENTKSFIPTKNALTVFNHYSLHLLRPGIRKNYFFPFEDAQLNHYKESCDAVIFPECSTYLSSPKVVDKTIVKFRNKFNENYKNVLKKISYNKIL